MLHHRLLGFLSCLLIGPVKAARLGNSRQWSAVCLHGDRRPFVNSRSALGNYIIRSNDPYFGKSRGPIQSCRFKGSEVPLDIDMGVGIIRLAGQAAENDESGLFSAEYQFLMYYDDSMSERSLQSQMMPLARLIQESP